MSKEQFGVLHDYGSDGWSWVGERYSSILDAVLARERDIANGGGTVLIVEVIDTIDAYRRADYKRDEIARQTKQAG